MSGYKVILIRKIVAKDSRNKKREYCIYSVFGSFRSILVIFVVFCLFLIIFFLVLRLIVYFELLFFVYIISM